MLALLKWTLFSPQRIAIRLLACRYHNLRRNEFENHINEPVATSFKLVEPFWVEPLSFSARFTVGTEWPLTSSLTRRKLAITITTTCVCIRRPWHLSSPERCIHRHHLIADKSFPSCFGDKNWFRENLYVRLFFFNLSVELDVDASAFTYMELLKQDSKAFRQTLHNYRQTCRIKILF